MILLAFVTPCRAARAAATVEATLLSVEGGTEREVQHRDARDRRGRLFELSGYLGLGFEQCPSAISLKIYGPPSTVEVCATGVQLRPLTVE